MTLGETIEGLRRWAGECNPDSPIENSDGELRALLTGAAEALEAKQHEANAYFNHWKTTLANLEKSEARVRELESSIRLANTAYDESQARVRELGAELRQAELLQSKLEAERDEAEARVRELEEAAAGDVKVAADAVDKIRELEAELTETGNTIIDLRATNAQLLAERDRLQDRLLARSSERDRLKALVADGGVTAAKLDEVLAAFPKCKHCDRPARYQLTHAPSWWLCQACHESPPEYAARPTVWAAALEAVEKCRRRTSW